VVQTHVNAGVCGFVTDIEADSPDQQNVTLAIRSTCDKITALAKAVDSVDAYSEIMTGFEGKILTAARQCLQGCCSGCVVPAGIFKTMQVAAGLALPRDIAITICKNQTQS
jgi:hypothetical protein